MTLDLNRIRSDFPALGESIYMNTGGTGPLSRQMVDSITGQYRAPRWRMGPDTPSDQEARSARSSRGHVGRWPTSSGSHLRRLRC